MTSRLKIEDGDAAAIHRVITSRFSCKKFLPTPVADSVIADLLALTLRSPSSFSTMPFKCVVVKTDSAKEALAGAMLAANPDKVKEAAFSVVFLSDLGSRLTGCRQLANLIILLVYCDS